MRWNSSFSHDISSLIQITERGLVQFKTRAWMINSGVLGSFIVISKLWKEKRKGRWCDYIFATLDWILYESYLMIPIHQDLWGLSFCHFFWLLLRNLSLFILGVFGNDMRYAHCCLHICLKIFSCMYCLIFVTDLFYFRSSSWRTHGIENPWYICTASGRWGLPN